MVVFPIYLKIISLFWVTLRVLLAASASSWLVLWVSLEINLLGFALFMVLGGLSISNNLAIKYLVVQSLGSRAILVATLLSISQVAQPIRRLMFWVSLSLKLGLFPFHGWIIRILCKLRWEAFVGLVTIQKLLPLLIISSFAQTGRILLATLNLVAMATAALVNSHISATLSYLSAAGASWALIPNSFALSLSYLALYGISIATFVYAVGASGGTGEGSVALIMQTWARAFAVVCLLLRARGMPPLLGFWVKLIILLNLGKDYLLAMVLILLVSLMVLLAYIRMAVPSLMGRGVTGALPVSLTLPLMAPGVTMLLFPLVFFIYKCRCLA